MTIFRFSRKPAPDAATLPDWMLTFHPGQLLTTFPYESEYGKIIQVGMMNAERLYARNLLQELDEKNVDGSIVEFGVFNGDWLETLIDAREAIKSPRDVWGFDSFEGLPNTTEHDLDCWKQGDYAYDYELVAKRLRANERPWLNLKKGWFADTLPQSVSLSNIAYARIDCDLYGPTVECLDFLTDRLSDGAILVFDDWTYDASKGETKAFIEWLAKNRRMQPEFLAANSIGHFYFRMRV